MSETAPPYKLRPALPDDAPLLAILMQASIEELAVDDYSDDQRAAWAAVADDEETWAGKLAANLTLVALDEDSEPVGFAMMLQNRALAHVHVHPDLARTGIARMLCDALTRLALARGSEGLVADVPDNARPFFLALGFVEKARNTINFGEEWLGMTTMEKLLKAPATAVVQ